MKLGSNDYRKGALDRLGDAAILLIGNQYGGCAYVAGRAVEGILRAVIWNRDTHIRTGRKPLETGHDLRELLTRVQNLGLLDSAGPRDQMLSSRVQQIGRLWFNDMRFVSSKFVESRWDNLGEVRKGRTLKQATESFYLACEAVVRRMDQICQK